MSQIAATQSVPGYAKPVFAEYFADPFVFRAQDRFFAVGTGPSHSSGAVFHMLCSDNLKDWVSVGYAMDPIPARERSSYWAPEISEFEGRYFLYYSVGEGDVGHRIRVASADQPTGPYNDHRAITAEAIPFAIDPHVYRHIDGSAYLFYATDFLDGDRPGTGLVVDRLLSPTELSGNPVVVARAQADWQRYQSERNIYGGIYDWHTLEGPASIWYDGKIYVLYSGGNWQNESYGVDLVSALHPLGPYTSSNCPVPRVLRSGLAGLIGPGHNSFVQKDGEVFTAFHAWNTEGTARLMHIGRLGWTDDGPVLS